MKRSLGAQVLGGAVLQRSPTLRVDVLEFYLDTGVEGFRAFESCFLFFSDLSRESRLGVHCIGMLRSRLRFKHPTRFRALKYLN